MKSLIFIPLVLLALSSFADADQKQKVNTEAQLAENQILPLIPSEQIWFYGFIPKDAWVSHHYFLYNPHDDTVTITKMISGCECTHIPRGPVVIPPQQTYLLKSQFDTRTYSGELNRDIHIVTDYEPSPEMDLYFISLTASAPRSLSISPSSTMFIKGKKSQSFIIKNKSTKTTNVTVLTDNDSTLSVSDVNFKIKGQDEHELIVKPHWEDIEKGQHYSCVVLEITRKEEIFRIAIPIKIVLF
ncbi:MAG: DUF1573 domain-containing protein [FCB group bacterium]|nr:DUF1573 domain-containing protein [FCB group bacterium]